MILGPWPLDLGRIGEPRRFQDVCEPSSTRGPNVRTVGNCREQKARSRAPLNDRWAGDHCEAMDPVTIGPSPDMTSFEAPGNVFISNVQADRMKVAQ